MDFLWLLLEVVIELLAVWPVDNALSKLEKRKKEVSAEDAERSLGYWLAALAAILCGALAAWASTVLWPNLWPASVAGRVFMLVGAPPLIGGVAYMVNTAKEKRGKDWLEPWRHAGFAALFALAWAVTRTLLAASAG